MNSQVWGLFTRIVLDYHCSAPLNSNEIVTELKMVELVLLLFEALHSGDGACLIGMLVSLRARTKCCCVRMNAIFTFFGISLRPYYCITSESHVSAK